MPKYYTPVEFCRPDVLAEFKENLITKKEELLRLFMRNREAFAVYTGKLNGEFIGDVLSKSDEELFSKPVKFFEAIAEQYGIYFSAVQYRTLQSVTGQNTCGDDVFEVLRGRFGTQFDLYIHSFIIYLARKEAWDNYWSKEFA